MQGSALVVTYTIEGKLQIQSYELQNHLQDQQFFFLPLILVFSVYIADAVIFLLSSWYFRAGTVQKYNKWCLVQTRFLMMTHRRSAEIAAAKKLEERWEWNG